MDFSHVNQRPSHVLAKKNPEEPTFNPVLGGLKSLKIARQITSRVTRVTSFFRIHISIGKRFKNAVLSST